MTKEEKIDFFEAVYKCALGDSGKYNDILTDLSLRSGGVTAEQVQLIQSAFDLAREDLRFAEERLRGLARSKAERFIDARSG